uniref:Venom peptide 4 n=1 Tax=Orancistrocerus drewseni TaxID=529024 RepID=VP4_ORADR|nr:RecName: Full=Venom peptide 4; Short=OdVP4; Short=VP4 [Orancistrocerus drewseni]
LDPKVVQSLL